MKAIILAAGFGKRMMPLTRESHKTLLHAGGRPVLGRIISVLEQCGIRDLVIVTGYRAELLRDFVEREFPHLGVEWVHNERFHSTNNIYSLALALEGIPDQEILIIESDLIFQPQVIERLLASPYPDVALVGRFQLGMDGTVVAIENDLVTQFIPPHLQSENFDFSDKFKTLNIYRFSENFCRDVFRPIITFYARTIDANCYYESVLGIIIYMQRARVYAEVVDNEFWAEVDDPTDLEVAEFQFNPEGRASILERSHGGYWKYPVTDFCFIRNMYFPTGSMLSDMRNHLSALLFNYGSSQRMLDQKLGYLLDRDPEQVVLLNGASQVFPILRERLKASRVLVPRPSFGEYERIAPNVEFYEDRVGIDLEEIAGRVRGHDVVVFVNPNNPSGTTLPSEKIAELASTHREKLFLIDESFVDFAPVRPMLELMEEYQLDNVLVVKSLSKVLGVPGLRLGFAYSRDTDIVAGIRDRIPIWNTNSIAEYFLELMFKRRPELRASVQRTIDDREDLAARLREVAGVHEVYPSGGNFLLARMDPAVFPSPAVVGELLARHAVFVKDVSARMGGRETYLRFAVRTPPENRRLVEILGSLGAR